MPAMSPTSDDAAPAAPRTAGPRRRRRRRRARAPRRRRARRWRAGRRRRTCRSRRRSRDPCPSLPARASLAAVRAVPSGRADSARAICTAAVPTPLPTAWMSTVSPAPSPACDTIASQAVMNASGMAARVGERERVGHARQRVGVGHQLLGVGAAADEPEDAIADLPGGDAGADARRSRRRTPAPGSAAAHRAAPDRGPCAAGGRRGSPPSRARARALRRAPAPASAPRATAAPRVRPALDHDGSHAGTIAAV